MRRTNEFARVLVLSMCFGLLAPIVGYAQSPTFTTTVQNQSVVNDTIFQFDIHVLRTGRVWRMADATFQLTFSTGNFANLTVSYVSESTQLAAGYVISPDINSTRINVEIQSPTTYASSTEISDQGNGTKIGTFRISKITNPSGYMNLAWRTPVLTYQAMNERTGADASLSILSDGTYSDPSSAPLPIQLAGC